MLKFVFLKRIVIVGWFWIILSSCQSVVFFSSKANFNSMRNASDIGFVNERRRLLLEEAERWIGVPYCLGGNDKCVDCSGLAQAVYTRIGIPLPRTAEEQSKVGKFVPLDAVEIGDLLFFGKRNRVTHVAIYAGNGEVIHSSTSRGVVRDRLESLSQSFLFAKKLIE